MDETTANVLAGILGGTASFNGKSWQVVIGPDGAVVKQTIIICDKQIRSYYGPNQANNYALPNVLLTLPQIPACTAVED